MSYLQYTAAFFLIAAFFSACQSANDEPKPIPQPKAISKNIVAKPDTTSIDTLSHPTKPTLYKSESGNYSIMFPGEPTEKEQRIAMQGFDRIDMQVAMYEPTPNKIYMVSYADYPEEIVRQATDDNRSKKIDTSKVSSLVQNAKDGAVGKLQLNITSEQEIMLGKYKGIAFTANNGNTAYTSYNIFLVGNRLYQLAILSQNKPIEPDDAKDFLASFQLLK